MYAIGYGNRTADGSIAWNIHGACDALIGEIVGRENAQRVVNALNWSEAEARDFVSTIEPVVIDAQPTGEGE